ncbi:NADP-dependent oxidoreductase [Mucilaginibacter endophyticus]|uniref:NADP-dependent oxidoreductase n=1 Tax=Mucilaginibacter endophyticus TaxID=2675003 RepID=UPI000E0D7B24|nr:NADP-dependent oxidoreductase [Mucilaginibacter endophyticus]
MKSKLIRLASLPEGMPREANFNIDFEELPAMKTGEVLLKTLYISVDPYLRAKMAGGHKPPLITGDVMYSRAVAEVIDSARPDFKPGDKVLGFLEWRDYLLYDGEGLTLINNNRLPLSSYLGILGSTGLSAYFALTDIGQPKPGETLVVSGAAGAVGSIAGQIGKLMGCRVIGIAGSNEKVEWMRSKLGFDGGINYKTSPDIGTALANLCPDGTDVYFDNVGGIISDAVISTMNDYGRVVVCGSIASYNDTAPETGVRLLPLVVYKKLLIRGFLIADYKACFNEGIHQLQQWLTAGRLHYAETIMDGFDKLPEAFIGLFEGKNEGKMIVRL